MVFGDAAGRPLRLSRLCPRLKGNNAGSLVVGERFQNSLAIASGDSAPVVGFDHAQ